MGKHPYGSFDFFAYFDKRVAELKAADMNINYIVWNIQYGLGVTAWGYARSFVLIWHML